MNFDKIKEFPVVIYNNLEEYNKVLSKARVRIFYKGHNRNGTYITDEFAEKLLKTLPYAPIKGIYEDGDFTTHGEARTEGRAYGVVMGPDDLDFSWETHLDEDGIEREYACANVLLWTGLYEEAKEIPGKSQSMELYEPSIQGSVIIRDGRRCFEYTDACFLGLQALGELVEPCFEGSAFYSLYTSLKETLDNIKDFTLKQDDNKGGQAEMHNVNFKLSDSEKHSAIFMALNPSFNEEGNWTITYTVLDVYEKYALCYNYEAGQYEQVDYTKDDAADVVTIGERRKCFIVDITESEKAALDALHAMNGGTFEMVNENFVAANSFDEDRQNFESKIEELNTSVSTLTTEKGEIQTQLDAANNSLNSLKTENEQLAQYKLDSENAQKQTVIDRYSELLDDSIISKYTENLGNYTVESIEKELAFELVNTNPSVFTKTPQFVPKDVPTDGLSEILSKYKK
jgi:hypothetical protein